MCLLQGKGALDARVQKANQGPGVKWPDKLGWRQWSSIHINSANAVTEDVWYANGGASDHMTDNKNVHFFWICTWRRWSVSLADNRKLWVTGVADIKVSSKISNTEIAGTIKKVLYVLDLRRTMFSTGQATGKGITTLSEKQGCKMISNVKVVMEGVRDHRMYHLNLCPAPKPTRLKLIHRRSMCITQQQHRKQAAKRLEKTCTYGIFN